MNMISIEVLAGIGFFISLYAYLVERQIGKEPAYKPFCDLNDTLSCTRPMKSPYANFFFFSNALIGMFFYGVVMLLSLLGAKMLLLYTAMLSLIATCFMAYILYYKVRTICLLCTAVYCINIFIFILLMTKG